MTATRQTSAVDACYAPPERRAAGAPGAQAVTSNGAANGICNQNLPNDSVYKRFLYVISALANNGFYVGAPPPPFSPPPLSVARGASGLRRAAGR